MISAKFDFLAISELLTISDEVCGSLRRGIAIILIDAGNVGPGLLR